MDAYDTEDFDEKLEKVITKWRNVSQPSCADIEGFINWFRVSKAPVVQESMLQSIREDCGLGSLPIKFTANACEAANSVLKEKRLITNKISFPCSLVN